jgi:hypothetical protein
MTINKSQGYSFNTVSVDLQTPVFSHSQFYIAILCVSDSIGLYVLFPNKDPKTITNIVWLEILQDLA